MDPKPYMIIEGSSLAIETFEQKVAKALEMGYSLAGELVTHAISATELKFFQSVMMAEDDYEDDEEDDEEFDEEDE